MSRRRYPVEAIIRKLREAEVELSRGQTVKQVAKKLGINEQTYRKLPLAVDMLKVELSGEL